MHVKGPKGELKQVLVNGVSIAIDGTTLTVNRDSEAKQHRALHGLYRSLISNMIIGVSAVSYTHLTLPTSDLV